MSEDIFTQGRWNLKQSPSSKNVPIEESTDPRDNNQIIKMTMVFPQIGIVTHG